MESGAGVLQRHHRPFSRPEAQIHDGRDIHKDSRKQGIRIPPSGRQGLHIHSARRQGAVRPPDDEVDADGLFRRLVRAAGVVLLGERRHLGRGDRRNHRHRGKPQKPWGGEEVAPKGLLGRKIGTLTTLKSLRTLRTLKTLKTLNQKTEATTFGSRFCFCSG